MVNIISQSKWVKQQPGVADLPVNTQKQMYDEYVASQHISQQTELTTTDLVTQRYREFLKSVLISITDEDVEIRRFLRNIDINNKEDVSLVIPFYVERLKQIGSYFVNKRREVFTVTDTVGYNGSAEGIKREMKRFLLTLLSDLSFKTKYKSADIPNIDVLTENAVIEIEELYEEVESNDSKIKQQIEAILFLDPDFKRSIVSLFKTFPIQPVDRKSKKFLYTSDGRPIRVNVKRTNIQHLPEQFFLNGVKTADNLIFNYQKLSNEKYSGTDFHYLSSTSTEQVSGKLFSALNPEKNIPNQTYPTLNFNIGGKNTKSIRQIGGFFLPKKYGITTLHSTGLKAKLSDLKKNEIISFPDPSKYGDITHTGLITFTEDNMWLKANKTGENITGDIFDRYNGIQKFYGYQTREETLKLNVQGLSRAEDNVEFWIGEEKNIWGNEDVYPKKALRSFDITGKQDDLLVTDKTVYAWEIDSYGNEFALYKETQPIKKNLDQQKGLTQSPEKSLDFLPDGTPTPASYPANAPITDIVYGEDVIIPDSDLFIKPKSKYFIHQYNTSKTQYETNTNSLNKQISLLDVENAYGEIYFRSANSKVIASLESMHEHLFIKYINDVDVYNELKSKVKDIDVFNDVLVVLTENYLVIEKYYLDTDDILKSSPAPKVYLRVQDRNLEKIGKPWYYEEKNQLFVIKTVLHPHLKGSNYKIIYPEITIVNLDSLTTSKVFPGTDILTDSNTGKPFTTYTQLAEHNLSLLNTQHSINFVKVGSPQLSFNRGTKTYSLTYVAFDTTGMAYLFSYWLKRKENTFKLIRSTLLKPDKAIHSTNFTDFNTVSGQAVSQFDTTVITGNQINDDGLTHLYLNDHPMGIPQNHGYNGWRPGEILTPANLNPKYTNKNAHAIIKSNNSLLCMGKKISKNEYRTLHNTVTYFRPRLTIQGGEKITITSNVAFYTYNGHAPARGACIFIYDKSDNGIEKDFSLTCPGNADNKRNDFILTSGYSIINNRVFGINFNFTTNEISVLDSAAQEIGLVDVSAIAPITNISNICTTISNRSEIQFHTIKVELEVVSNKLIVSIRPHGQTTFYEYISLNIQNNLIKFEPMLGVGMSVFSKNKDYGQWADSGDPEYLTNCEIKDFSVAGGLPSPETTMVIGTSRTTSTGGLIT